MTGDAEFDAAAMAALEALMDRLGVPVEGRGEVRATFAREWRAEVVRRLGRRRQVWPRPGPARVRLPRFGVN